MNVLVCPDKFKGSLTAAAVCHAIRAGIHRCDPDAQVVCHPLADGGEGMLDILAATLDIQLHEVEVSDPLFRPVLARYGFDPSADVAYIEMSSASGLQLLNTSERNCLQTTTLGTGELMLAAIARGARRIVLGVGGSATNDAGMGVAAALGFRFFNDLGQPLPPIGGSLPLLSSIDSSSTVQGLAGLSIEIASDVQNPFCGAQGAAHVFARQKGASDESIALLDLGLENIARLIQDSRGKNIRNIPGAGAAGGLGGGCAGLLGASLRSGIDMIMEITGLDQRLVTADLVITGEGRLDEQTMGGKVVAGVLSRARVHGIPVAVLCGTCVLTEEDMRQQGIFYCDTLAKGGRSEDNAIKHCAQYLQEAAPGLIDAYKQAYTKN